MTVGIGIDQQLGGIESMLGAELVGPIHAEAGATLQQVNVPGLIGPFLQTNQVRLLRSIWPIEQAQLNRSQPGRDGNEV